MTNTQKNANKRNSIETKEQKEIDIRKMRKKDKISKMRMERSSLED
jgi:hypothetical protein